MPEPDVLFSPLPEEKPDAMTGARSPDSTLFKLDEIAGPGSAPHVGTARPPDQPTSTASDRDSSGLVDINKILASEESRGVASPSALGSGHAARLAGSSVDPLADDTPLPARPAVPRPILVGFIVALLAAALVLTWIATQG